MAHFWEQSLHQIREQVLMMSGLTERNLALAVRSLLERNDKLADMVESEDTDIDQLEIQVDEMVVTFIATRGAVASDTRFIFTASKISSNLERIADEATTIARRARELTAEPALTQVNDIPVLATSAQEMLRDSITAFVEKQTDLAVEIIARDKTVDDVYRNFVKELTECMQRDPSKIQCALKLMTIAKALERVADHATNIAEEVYYLYKAEDIRHDHTVKQHGPG